MLVHAWWSVVYVLSSKSSSAAAGVPYSVGRYLLPQAGQATQTNKQQKKAKHKINSKKDKEPNTLHSIDREEDL
jgi:hypothetical protein